MRRPDSALLRDVERYYSGRIKEHGPTARGVDWNSADSQELRFKQLAKLWDEDEGEISLIDFGCGYGALVDYLQQSRKRFRYQGYDLSEAMIREAESRASTTRTFTTDAQQLQRTDYVVASGVFNVKLETPADAWKDYMRQTIESLAALATRGFAFNALTSYSDKEHQREDLYYAEPLYWFDHCKQHYSRFVTLLHDYPLYEFTMLVRI